jgi:hypothetical protein
VYEPPVDDAPVDQPSPLCAETKGKDTPNYFKPGISAGAYAAGFYSCAASATDAFLKERGFAPDDVVRGYCKCAIETALDLSTTRFDAAALETCGRRASSYQSALGDRKLSLEKICMAVNAKDAAYCSCYVDGTLAGAKNVDAFCREIAEFWRQNRCHKPKSAVSAAE